MLVAAVVLSLGAAYAVAADDKHEHPEKGPHKGALIELGEEEFHAEILHDHESHAVTVFVLDSHAEKAVPIDSKEILINLRNGRHGKQFKLAATPLKGERTGAISRFVLRSEELCDLLDDHGTEARLNLKIKGRAYAGKVPHLHDHGHDHK
jgi:hypothetical protein